MSRALDNSDGPQMNANEREFALVRHSGAGRTAFAGLQTRTPKAAHGASAMDGASNPFSGMTKIKLDPGFRRDDGKVAA